MRRSRRMMLTAAVTALLPAAALLSSALTAPATGASLPTLAQAFNNVGITSSSHATAGNYDGIGDSFSAPGLAEDALLPGQSLLHDGMTITWPDVAPGDPDNVVADGQTIALAGTGSVLGVIGASAYGSTTGTFTVGYSDGTSSTATVTLADWVDTNAASGTDLLATTAGWNPGGTTPVSLSYAAIPLTAGKRVTSVTLPTVSSGVGKNVPAMHVFSLTIGSPAAEAAGARGDPADRGQAGHLSHAAHSELGRRQERPGDARLQPHDRLARGRGGRRTRRSR